MSPVRRTRALRDFLTTAAAALALCYFGTTQAAPLVGSTPASH
jgi:sulfonate transport system substrate-binding protein